MSANAFNRLAPFIKEYIYRHKWSELRDLQVRACEVIFETDSHLVLSAGTASGKTEAAFLPILTLLDEDPSESVGVLYIGPTKALINDQFYRLEGLLEEAHIPVTAWHGDASASKKKKLLQNPQGILQITPESIESLLINKRNFLTNLFCDLRFIVIDEIHIFMASNRGRQILCQLERLQRFMETSPRRIGLSATLGDTSQAERWLVGNDHRSAITVTSKHKPSIRLSVAHFQIDAESEQLQPQDNEYLFAKATERSKVLVFANSRGGAEEVIASFRKIAQQKNFPDVFHVHHGSISAPLRETAEEAMKASHQQAITAATLTLEVGVDIGQLERVIQIDSPFSVSSFLQRLGRSGRRNLPSEMMFAITEPEISNSAIFPEQLPWDLLQTIAIIQLHLTKKWIEPVHDVKQPFGLLYHQTLSTLVSESSLSAASLARSILTLPPFRHISTDQYKSFLRHLIQTQHIERAEDGELIVGLAAEKITNNYKFFAVFKEEEDYIVRSAAGEVGRINSFLPPGEKFRLAGRTWVVEEVDSKLRSIFVKKAKGRANSAWMGGGGAIHSEILQMIRTVLTSQEDYRYLQESAKVRLSSARKLSEQFSINSQTIIPIGGTQYCILPWLGSYAFRSLLRFLNSAKAQSVNIKHIGGKVPYYAIINSPNGIQPILDLHDAFKLGRFDPKDLITDNEVPIQNKYDEFVAPQLLREGFVLDYITTT